MLKYTFLFAIAPTLLCSCNTGKKITIYPLDPYEIHHNFTDDSTGTYLSTAIIKYYVVYGDISDTGYIRNILTEFALKNVDIKLLNENTVYNIEFYKKTDKTNKEFKETHFDKIEFHSQDNFATYSWTGLLGDLRFYNKY